MKKKDKEILITLAITIYKPEYYEIKNWLNYYQRLKNQKNIQLIFLIDNPEIDENILNLLKKEKAEYKIYDKNYGKFYIIKDACDKNLIKGTFLKICDPDDLIYVNALKKFCKEELIKLNKKRNYLITTNAAILKAGNYTYDNFKHENIKLKMFNKIAINSNSIFSTKIIKEEIKNKYLHLTKSSDILFSILALLSQKTIFITIEKGWFYIYNRRKGISSYNKFNHNKNKLKEEYRKLFYDTFRYLKILDKMSVKISEIKYLEVPRKFDIWTINNSLINSKFFIFKRIFYIRTIYKIFKKIEISEGNWFFLILYKYYFYQIFRIHLK